MSSRKPRIWRYAIDEVWGDEPAVKVGDVILDKWKSDRVWQFYKIPEMVPTWGYHAKVVSEVEGELADTVRAHWRKGGIGD